MRQYIGPICLMIFFVATTYGDESAENTPVVVDDGRDNFLILNNDEVKANAQLLYFLSSASKEEVEELVGSNPKYQEIILNRIRSAVEARRQNRRNKESKEASNEEAKVTTNVSKPTPIGMPVEKSAQVTLDNNGGGEEDEADDEEDDDDDVINKLQVAKFQADVKKNTLKIFKIGNSLRAKLAASLKKSNLKSKQKTKKKRKNGTVSWPVFHYQMSTTRNFI